MEAIEPPKESSLLERIRNMWEFANLVQWIFIFGKAVKIDEELDVEVGSLNHLDRFRSSHIVPLDAYTSTYRTSRWNA